jgi:iron complex transport system substrate-binding protein
MNALKAIFLAAALALAGPSAGGQEKILLDDLGNPHRMPPSPPQRIVSMAPNITEILFALGLGDKIVGVTRFCDFPEAASDIPKIGGLIDPNLEIIHSLEPDLVIAFRGNPLRFLERLRDFLFPVFVLDIGKDTASLFPLIEKIGLITGKESDAARLNDSMRAKIRDVENRAESIQARPKVFVMLYGQGLWTCGADSYLDDLLVKAGAVNVAGHIPKKWFLYSRERLVRDDPEVIIVLANSEKDFRRARDRLLGKSAYKSVSAVRTGRIFRLDENAASRFGPRLIDVLGELVRILHPEGTGVRP